MKRFFLCMLMVASAMLAMAQHVTGIVIESDSQEPVAQTTVRILKSDSTLVTGGLTDLDGKFRVKAPSAGKYIVSLSWYRVAESRCYHAEGCHCHRTCSQSNFES